jgi:anaerobic selenocysteine-containing dehydrogenase
MAEVENGEVVFLQGNPHVPAMKGALCPRGAAGIALMKDSERPKYPMIRDGERGIGAWRKVIPIRYQKLINPVKCCKRFNGIFILSEFI